MFLNYEIIFWLEKIYLYDIFQAKFYYLTCKNSSNLKVFQAFFYISQTPGLSRIQGFLADLYSLFAVFTFHKAPLRCVNLIAHRKIC